MLNKRTLSSSRTIYFKIAEKQLSYTTIRCFLMDLFFEDLIDNNLKSKLTRLIDVPYAVIGLSS